MLRTDPDVREAPLRLARSLAALGKLGDARDEYVKLIRQHRHDVEAMVGIAQTYHWTGASDIARELRACSSASSRRPVLVYSSLR